MGCENHLAGLLPSRLVLDMSIAPKMTFFCKSNFSLYA